MTGGRLAYAVASRQVTGLSAPALTLRIIALTVVLTVLVQQEHSLPLLLALPAVAACLIRATRDSRVLQHRSSGSTEGGAERLDPPAGSSAPAAVRRHRWWVLVSWCDVGSALLLVGVASWGTAALPAGSRFLALGASAMLLAGVSTRLSLDPRWYRPDRRPGPLSRLARQLAGPLGAAACLAAALPAPWTADGRAAVVLISLIPLAAFTLTQDQEQTMHCLVEMVQTEAQDGRQAVLDELHGTLSANLRLIEQHSLQLRSRSPRLYELAVGANSRLRETLTLGDPELEDVRAPASLAALVRTLAMAVGARGELVVTVTELADRDRDLVRLTLNDVVRGLLAGGAMHVRATIGIDEPGRLTVRVVGSDQAGQGLPAGLQPLAERLGQLGGSVTGETTQRGESIVLCRWPAAPGTR